MDKSDFPITDLSSSYDSGNVLRKPNWKNESLEYFPCIWIDQTLLGRYRGQFVQWRYMAQANWVGKARVALKGKKRSRLSLHVTKPMIHIKPSAQTNGRRQLTLCHWALWMVAKAWFIKWVSASITMYCHCDNRGRATRYRRKKGTRKGRGHGLQGEGRIGLYNRICNEYTLSTQG